MIRVGQGLDVHAFSSDPDRPLVLGGLVLPGPGLEGHSDADVVLHAITDALLGAAVLGDLGTLFGSDDPRYAGVPSSTFLEESLRRAAAAGWSLTGVDCTIVAQRPRIGPYRTALPGCSPVWSASRPPRRTGWAPSGAVRASPAWPWPSSSAAECHRSQGAKGPSVRGQCLGLR